MGDDAMVPEHPFHRLGDDELHHIFAFLDAMELCVAADVCRRWRQIAEPFLRNDYLSIPAWYRNPVPSGRWKEAVTEPGPDDDKEPSWRRLYKAHHVVERNWRRGSYTITEVPLPEHTLHHFRLDNARGVLHAVIFQLGRHPRKEPALIEIRKRTLEWDPVSVPELDGKRLDFNASEVGRFAVIGLGENDVTHLVFRPGVLRMFGITPTRVGDYEAVALPTLGGINGEITDGRDAEDSPDYEFGFGVQLLKRDTRSDGTSSLTFGGTRLDGVRLIRLHEPERHEIYPWPLAYEVELREQVDENMILMNFDETHVFVCSTDRMLIYERPTREMVCQLELKDPTPNLWGTYPVAVTYQWPEHPPQPVTYRVSQPPLLLEPTVFSEDEISNYDPHGDHIFDGGCPEPAIDSDNLLIKLVGKQSQHACPQLLIPRYRSVMAGLRSVPRSERDAYIRARMIALRASQTWVQGYGAVMRGHRLLVSCALNEGLEGQNPTKRDALFVFDLRDLPALPLQPGSSGPPSLVPIVACRGPPSSLDQSDQPEVLDNEAVFGLWSPRDMDMDNEAIYLFMTRTVPTPTVGRMLSASSWEAATECSIKTMRFDSAIREPV